MIDHGGGVLRVPGGLRAGEFVVLEAPDGSLSTHRVATVDGDTCRLEGRLPAHDRIHVHGHMASDIRGVDYHALSMLHVSATQELRRQHQAELERINDELAKLRREIGTLKSRLTRLSGRKAAPSRKDEQ